MSHRRTDCEEVPDLLTLMTADDGHAQTDANSAPQSTDVCHEPETRNDGGAGDDDLEERRRTRREQRKQEKAGRPPRPPVPPVTSQAPQASPGEGFLSVKQLARRWNVGVATVWRWSARGIIPPPVLLGPGTTRWRAGEILAYEASRQKGSAQ